MNRLDRDKKIVLLRKNNLCMTQDEIARRVNLSAARVGQILKAGGIEPKHWIQKRVCLNCGGVILMKKTPGGYRHYNRHFCDMRCYLEYRNKNHYLTVYCFNCGKKLKRRITDLLQYDFRIKHGSKGRTFCDKKCFGQYIGTHYGFGVKKCLA